MIVADSVTKRKLFVVVECVYIDTCLKFPSFGGRRLRVGQNSQAVRRNVPQGVAFVGAGRWSLTDSG
jgi:hypothetical protein